ncbi:MAG: hypothetical protein LQ337_003856 [Flavoplaca oasis]|nr:MAG: hypothetical protein LQ337_003856 [Flavoplaca oasis]
MVRFIDVYERLPASAPVGHPHIVEDFNEETDKDNLRGADGICTMLYRYNPSVLRDFLDLEIPVIEVVRHEKTSNRYDMIIARHERVVTVIPYLIPPYMKTVANMTMSKCGFMRDAEFVDLRVDFGIKEEGLWVPLSGHSDLFYPTGPNRAEILDGFGEQLAAQIMYHKLWDESTAKEIKVDIERERP